MDWAVLEEADWFFRKTVRSFVKQRDRIKVEGIALPGMLILSKINRDGEQRLGDLAEELDLTSGAVTGLCDKLEKNGFAVRRRLAEDRRTVMLDITDQGRELLRRNRNIGTGCIEVLFNGFTEKELNEQIKYYERLLVNLEHFSETIMKLAEQNAKNENPVIPDVKREQASRNKNYFTY